MKPHCPLLAVTPFVLITVGWAYAQPLTDVQDQRIRARYGSLPCSKGPNPASCTRIELQRDLFMMIEYGSKDDALQALAKLESVNFYSKDSFGPPLSLAMRMGKPEIVSALLDKYADPLGFDRDGRQFLYTAIMSVYSEKRELAPEFIQCVRMVLEKAAARQGRMPIHPPPDATIVFYTDAEKPSLELLKLFLAHGADPTRPGGYSIHANTALGAAIATDNLNAVRIMVAPGNRISQSELDKRAFDALMKRKAELLAVLRSGGADPVRYMSANPKILSDAVRSEGIATLEFLYKNGADPSALENMLFGAASPEGSIEVLKFLLENGADPNILKQEKLRSTPIFFTGFDPEKIRLLLEYGADPNLKGDGYTLLAKVLFYHGKEISVTSSSVPGQAPRTYSKVSLVNLLLDHGADPNANNGNWGQWGALGLTRREDKEVIDLLIERGATLTHEVGEITMLARLKPEYGKAIPGDKVPGPITIAVDILERDDLALALLARDGKVGPKDRLALLQATRRGWREVAQSLLGTGADPNVANADGLTPLAMAERRRDEPLVKMLVAAGAKPSTQTVKPRYEIEGWSEFEKIIANEVDEIAFFDPPRFTLNLYLPRKETPFALYGIKINQYEEVKCERSVGFTIIANAGIAGTIGAGVCTQEAKRLRALATSAKQGMRALLDELIKAGALKANEGELAKFGWVFDKKAGPNQSEIFYFPVIGIGHGVLDAPTVVLVSENEDKAIIVQASVMNLCGEGRSMKSQTPLCSDTKSAITDIAQRLFARFGEK